MKASEVPEFVLFYLFVPAIICTVASLPWVVVLRRLRIRTAVWEYALPSPAIVGYPIFMLYAIETMTGHEVIPLTAGFFLVPLACSVYFAARTATGCKFDFRESRWLSLVAMVIALLGVSLYLASFYLPR